MISTLKSSSMSVVVVFPPSPVTLLHRCGYHYNSVGQRVKAVRENGHFWQYGYNDRGEVTSAKKHRPTGASGNQPLGGLQYEYAYDDLGNRTAAKYGGNENGSDLQTISYEVNEHNQYTSRSHPGSAYLTGLAGLTGEPPQPGTIKINNAPATAQDSFFFHKLVEENGSGPVVVPVTLEETPGGSGTPVTEPPFSPMKSTQFRSSRPFRQKQIPSSLPPKANS